MKWRIGIILLLLFGIGVLFIYAKLKVVSLVPDLSLPISASELTITSPTTGTVVVPGQTIPVSVSARSTFQAIQVIGENIGITPPKQNPPYSFVLTVPNNIAGPKKIVALGITGPDDEVFSPPVIVDIESQTSLATCQSNPGRPRKNPAEAGHCPLSLLLGLLLLHHRVARRAATVSFVNKALSALVHRVARRTAAVPFVDHAFGSSRDRGRDCSHEHEGTKAGQQRDGND
jgi:hypothetical protein